MQPHVNMGINFRKRFPLHEMGEVKAKNVIQAEMRRTLRKVRKEKVPFEEVKDFFKALAEFLK